MISKGRCRGHAMQSTRTLVWWTLAAMTGQYTERGTTTINLARLHVQASEVSAKSVMAAMGRLNVWTRVSLRRKKSVNQLLISEGMGNPFVL